jgi:DNA-binding transcriptional ArsR family regulator
METKTAVTALSALAHQGRLSAFRTLIQAGQEGISAGELARRLEVPPNSLSANLTILSHAGLIASRRDGRSVIYSAQYDSMAAVLEFLMEDCCAGSPEICASMAEVLRRSQCAAVTNA